MFFIDEDEIVIKCKEDLINTYIDNDHGDLRDLYLSKCEDFGFLSNSGRKPTEMAESSAPYFGMTETDGALSYSTNWSFADNGCKKLTISDLKPRTRTEYEKFTGSIFDLRDEFERGELYCKHEHAREYTQITNTQTLAQALHGGFCFRKVEKEIDWRDEVHAKLQSDYHWSTPIAEVVNDESDCFLELCRVALRANGEIE